MKITDKHLIELRKCELYQKMLPRYQKNLEWLIGEYINLSEQENIKTKTWFITKQKDGSIKIHSPFENEINRRRLLNLGVVDFDFGLWPTSDCFMPFFGASEIALFSNSRPIDEIDNGEVCLIKHKVSDKYFLVTKEETGFFELNCNYLGTYEEVEIVGILINVETK